MVKMNSIELMIGEVVKFQNETVVHEQKYLKADSTQNKDVAFSTNKCGEIHFSNKQFQLLCSHCQTKFVKIKSFSNHFLKAHLNLNINDVEIVINEFVSDEISLHVGDETLQSLQHQFNKLPERFVDENISNANIKEEDYSIDGCKQTNKDSDEILNSNTSNYHFENDISNENSSSFNDDLDLESYNSFKNCKLKCSYCHKLYKRKGDLTKHLILCKKKAINSLNEDNDQPFLCKFNCGRTFQRKCDLSHHENHKHNPDGSIKVWVPKIKTYICETCGNCYQRKHYLIQHQRVHTGERPYSCELCSKTFTKRNNLSLHMRHHSQERKFKCQYCGKGLTDANKLRMHEMIHTGLYPFKCDICGKKFPCNSKLNVHIKKHINDRIYKCDLCDKRFLDPETLKGHAAVHSDDKPFACEICPARFPRKGALRLHMNLHNDKKKYSCKICGMEFHQYNGIYSHYKRHGIKYSIAYEKGEDDGTNKTSKDD